MNLPPPETNYLKTMEEFTLATIHPARAWDCVLWALNDGFPFLTYTQISKPPSGWFEAALARQIGVWIMIEKLGVPKKRTIKIAGVSKEMTWRCFPKIERRLESVKFREHTERILADAIDKIERAHAYQLERNSD